MPDREAPATDGFRMEFGQSRHRTAPEGAVDGLHPAADLRSVVVEYPDRPDRRTVCPRSMTRDELMVTWFTADTDAFVDLWDTR